MGWVGLHSLIGVPDRKTSESRVCFCGSAVWVTTRPLASLLSCHKQHLPLCPCSAPPDEMTSRACARGVSTQVVPVPGDILWPGSLSHCSALCLASR